MKEPDPPEIAADHVDPDRNLAAMRALADEGIPKAEAEGHIEKPVSEWTAADLDVLRALLRSRRVDALVSAQKPPANGELSAKEEAQMEEELAGRG
jgi:hypothetical protein